MIFEAVLFCLLQFITTVASENNVTCTSTSLFIRKRCKINAAILDSDTCTKSGCCFDASPEVPAWGRCYQSDLIDDKEVYDGFNFHPTAITLLGSSISGRVIIGGERGYPGSQVILQCNPLVLCTASGFYQDERSACERQGCCWRSGQCYQNIWKIMRLRSKCPPGFTDPPACNAVNPCLANPCKNGGICSHIDSDKFTCDCPLGFTGPKCDGSCTRGQLATYGARVVPEQTQYGEGNQVELECKLSHSHQLGAVTTRVCVNGEFSPPLTTHPFMCFRSCAVVRVSGNILTVAHGVQLQYVCGTDFTKVLTRECVNGNLLPELESYKVVCSADCKLTQIKDAETMPKTLKHGTNIELRCLSTHTSKPSAITVRRCEDGKIIPDLRTFRFQCFKNCQLQQIDNAEEMPKMLVHGADILLKCQPSYAPYVTDVTLRKCENGKLVPSGNSKCHTKCAVPARPNAKTLNFPHKPPFSSVPLGTIVKYYCDSGYSLGVGVPSRPRVCKNGVLQPKLGGLTDVKCFLKCKVPELLNGMSANFTKGEVVEHNTEVNFLCNPYYSTPYTTMRKCVNGVFIPKIDDPTDPLKCYEDCKLKKIVDTNALLSGAPLTDSSYFCVSNDQMDIEVNGSCWKKFGAVNPPRYLAKNIDKWIEMDFNRDVEVTAIVTQARAMFEHWVTLLQIQYKSTEMVKMKWVKNGNDRNVFPANYDKKNLSVTAFSTPVLGRIFRITILSWHGGPSMRFDFLLC